MKLSEVQKLLDARVLGGEEYLDRQIETCCGSDMMSDVLAFTKRNTLLCTGGAYCRHDRAQRRGFRSRQGSL